VCVAFAVLCAESVLGIYEKLYPEWDAPRKAIKAAREYIKDPTGKATANAAYAAAQAAYVAYTAAHAAHVAHAATYIADPAYAAAYAANVATRAADVAAHDTYAQQNSIDTIDFSALADEAVRMVVDAQSGGGV